MKRWKKVLVHKQKCQDHEHCRCYDPHVAVIPEGKAVPVEATHSDLVLMAAAPELLKALKDVVALSDRKQVAWDFAHAVIAKAEGKS